MDSNYKKRTQKDYSLSLKLQIVKEIEQGLLTAQQATHKYGIQARSTIRTWLKKYGNFDYQNVSNSRTTYFRIRATSQVFRKAKKQSRIFGRSSR